MKRADELAGCEGELAAITDAIEAYAPVHWPGGHVDGGKGTSQRKRRLRGTEAPTLRVSRGGNRMWRS